MNNIAIIPARGGSKRIPRKNIKDFFGKPIIVYSIEAALKSNLFKEVMVSTDDPEIAEISKQYGAVIPFMRSAQNSDDYATTVDVLVEVLNNYNKHFNRSFEYGCCIYPTSPLMQISHLQEGYNKLKSFQLDSVFPVVPFGYPIQRSLQIIDDKTSFVYPQYVTARSQDLEKRYHDAGQWYWFNCNKLVNSGDLITNNTSSIILEELFVQDIDTVSDWKLAELKYELLQNIK